MTSLLIKVKTRALNFLKQKKNYLLIFLLAFGLFLPSFALAETIVFNPASVVTEQGSQFSVSINVDSVSNLNGLAFDLNYDASLLKYVDTTEGDFFSEGCDTWLIAEEYEPGIVSVALDRLGDCGGVSGSGNIVTINFSALNAGATELYFSYNEMCILDGENFNFIEADWLPAEVVINEAEQVDSLAPVINILEPEENIYNYLNINPYLTINGEASDNVGVTLVDWTNSDGTSGTASGTVNWQIPDILLEEGENIVIVTAYDEAGNSSSDQIIINYQSPDIIPPVISNITSSSTDNTITIGWQTNEPSSSSIFYGTDTNYASTTSTTTLTTSHNLIIDNLTPNTVYHFVISSTDANNNQATSSDQIISTLPTTDTTAPIRSQGLPLGALNTGTTQVILSLITDENAICRYATTTDVSYSLMANTFTTTSETFHKNLISDLSDGNSYTYYIKCQDYSGNFNFDDYLISFLVDSPAPPASTGSGGGGGSSGGSGGSSSSSASTSGSGGGGSSASSISSNNPTSTTGKVLGEFISNEKQINNQAEVSSVNQENKSDAQIIYDHNQFVPLNEKEKELYSIITKQSAVEIQNRTKYAIAMFIHDGTSTTKGLGAGERAGVVNSYIFAFGNLPQEVADWQDIIKIANGRWPTKQNINAEKKALAIFAKIYKRNPNFANKYDETAIKIISYGIRPLNRDLAKERFAINTFKNIWKGPPSSTNDWDIIRTIAYSGAKR